MYLYVHRLIVWIIWKSCTYLAIISSRERSFAQTFISSSWVWSSNRCKSNCSSQVGVGIRLLPLLLNFSPPNLREKFNCENPSMNSHYNNWTSVPETNVRVAKALCYGEVFYLNQYNGHHRTPNLTFVLPSHFCCFNGLLETLK